MFEKKDHIKQMCWNGVPLNFFLKFELEFETCLGFYTEEKHPCSIFSFFSKMPLKPTGHLFFSLFLLCERASKCGPRQNPEAERI